MFEGLLCFIHDGGGGGGGGCTTRNTVYSGLYRPNGIEDQSNKSKYTFIGCWSKIRAVI